MIFAKPEDGFEWAVSDKAKKQLNDILNAEPKIAPFWDALRERLVHTGHREGERITALSEANAFIFSMELDHLPNVQVVYTILGQTLTVQSVRIVNG